MVVAVLSSRVLAVECFWVAAVSGLAAVLFTVDVLSNPIAGCMPRNRTWPAWDALSPAVVCNTHKARVKRAQPVRHEARCYIIGSSRKRGLRTRRRYLATVLFGRPSAQASTTSRSQRHSLRRVHLFIWLVFPSVKGRSGFVRLKRGRSQLDYLSHEFSGQRH